MKTDITKVANCILYMLDKKVKYLNDKKLSIMLFLIDYNHLKFCSKKIFFETYIKKARQPEPETINEIFEIIANEEDLNENDEKLYLIQELLDYIDIEIIKKKNYIELKFLQIDEEFDETLFSKEEMKTIHKIVDEHKNTSPRNCANATFKIDIVRERKNREIII